MAHDYDLVIVGSGLAGASLAKVIAEAGRRVLVLERETRFRDRVRGEGMHPWGVAELRALGLYDLLTQRCAREVRWWVDSQVGAPERRNDLIESGPHHAGELTFYHPEMQETLSHAAEESGAEVRRGAMVKAVSPGDPPTVTWQQGDSTQTVRARLVVGADGRESRLRGWGGFDVVRDPERLRVSGVLLSGLGASEDAIQVFSSPGRGPATLIFPLGSQRFRTYIVSGNRSRSGLLSGKAQVQRFIEHSISTGVPEAWYAGVGVDGPLATFEGAPVWTRYPYRDGVVLIGDAAGQADPTFGCGMSLTMRDVRVLSDLLKEDADWRAAAERYAVEHNRYYQALHIIESWATEYITGEGPGFDQFRAQADQLWSEGLGPDFICVGPDLPPDRLALLQLPGH